MVLEWRQRVLMSYKLAICDDIEKDRDYISSLVQVWAERERLDTPFNVLDEPTAICACLRGSRKITILSLG